LIVLASSSLGEPPEGEEPEEIDPLLLGFFAGAIFGIILFWGLSGFMGSAQSLRMHEERLSLNNRVKEYKDKCKSLEADLQDAWDEIRQLHEAVVDVVVQDVQPEDQNIEPSTAVDSFSGKHLHELHYDKGMSYREIVNQTGLNVGTVKSRISRFKKFRGFES